MIKHPKAFNSLVPAGYDGVFDWDFLGGVFDRGIMPMDFDAVVETNGHFLIFETKFEGVEIPRGQELTLESTIYNHGATVFFLVFKREFGSETKLSHNLCDFEVWYKDQDEIVRRKCKPTSSEVCRLARKWFDKKDSGRVRTGDKEKSSESKQ